MKFNCGLKVPIFLVIWMAFQSKKGCKRCADLGYDDLFDLYRTLTVITLKTECTLKNSALKTAIITTFKP